MFFLLQMSDKEKKEVKITSHLSPESIKVIAETAGIGGLVDDAANHIADDVTFRLKTMVQVYKTRI